MRIDLKTTPTYSPRYTTDFPSLAGGLNLRDLGYLVDKDESPYMKNLIWRNGLLQSRPGQVTIATAGSPCYAVYEDLYHGYAFFHVGTTIRCLQVEGKEFDTENPTAATTITDTGAVQPGRGTFFRYQSGLYYKNDGGFYLIEHKANGSYGARDVPARFQATASGTDALFDLYVDIPQGDTPVSPTDTGNTFYRWTASLSPSDLDGHRVAFRHQSTGVLLRPNTETLPDPETEVTEAPAYIEVSDYRSYFYCTRDTIQEPDDYNPSVMNDTTYIALQCYAEADEPDDPTAGYLAANISGGIHRVGAAPRAGSLYAAWDIEMTNDGVRLNNLALTRLMQKAYHVKYIAAYTIPPAPFTCIDLATVAEETDNTPVIVINASPTNGSGTLYQPENRLSAKKTVWYNAVAGTTVYHLPVTDVSAVVRVEVDGTVLTSGYTVNRTAGTVTFATAPDPGNPQSNNTVRITYEKPNTTALQALLRCKYAAVVSGGEAAQYIVLGGNASQPDAIFWNGNDDLAIQPWYFPMASYNLVGTAGDAVTGFGRQYNDTLVFSEHTVGKLAYSTETVDGRLMPSFGYARVNSKIGCNLPETIQQVENNVVFANTYSGAHIVLSSSAAYENNIRSLSDKINDDQSSMQDDLQGLLADLNAHPGDVVSFDDDERYWLCANGHVYVWDYTVSTYAKPSWFYWTGIDPAGLFRDGRHNVYAVEEAGAVRSFQPVLSDDGEGIEKIYRFPTLQFGSYDRLKDVTDLFLSVRSDVPSTITVQYDTDHESRTDQTPITVSPYDANGQGKLYVQVAKRRPGCRHVRQFSLTLSNSEPDEDLALVSAQVVHRFVGRER